jgi:ATP-dependent Clp protease ATP-binding subunit ClpC
VNESLSADVSQLVSLAENEARQRGDSWVGTEHLLLGLLRQPEGPAARSLVRQDVTSERVLADAARMLGWGEGPVPEGSLPLTARATRALELAAVASLHEQHEEAGSEHVLLALLFDETATARRILLACDADLDAIRNEILGRDSR